MCLKILHALICLFLSQFNAASGGIERDQTARRGGCTVHSDPRSLAVEGVKARQHRDSARYRAYQGDANLRV